MGKSGGPASRGENGPPKIRGTSTLYKPHAAHTKSAWDHCFRQSRKVLTSPGVGCFGRLYQLRRCRQSQARADDANASQQYAKDSTSQRRVALLRRSHHPVRNRANHIGRVLKRTTCQCSGAARTSRGSTKAEPYLWRDSAPSLAVQGFFQLRTLCTLSSLFVEEVNQF